MRRYLACALAAPWTALVTSSFVGLAKLTGNPTWVARGERVWARGLLRAWGVEVTVSVAEELSTEGPYVIMVNHSSHTDVPILFAALPFVPGFLAKKELLEIPFLSMALRAGGHVLIDRSDRVSGMQGIKAAANEIRSGKTIAIFPEGTRGSGGLRPFKKGAFLIAKRAGVPIVPVGIRGSEHILPRGSWLPRKGRVSVHVGKPISPATAKALSIDGLCERVREEIARLSARQLEADGREGLARAS